MMDLLLTFRVLLLLCSLVSTIWACPEECRCKERETLCNDLSDFPTMLPTSTTNLFLINCSINVLKSEDIAVFSQTLTRFLVKSSALSQVESGTFVSTTNMAALGFEDTELEDLPEALFQNCKKLQSLSLKSNKLLLLQPNWFSQLANLKWLDLSRNRFTYVPEETFHPLAQLHVLFLSGNNISRLSKQTFKVLYNLKTLRLNKNSLEELPAGSFDDLVNLQELSLQDNLITQLSHDLFSKNLVLQKLFLSNNRLTSLPVGIFLNLPLLSQISLYENQLEHLGQGVFGPMNLQDLWLYDNKLSRVEDDTFKNLTQLRLLVLSRNQISYVSTRAFSGLVQLGEVSLHTNLLKRLQAGTFQGLPSLVNISLENNFISSLPLGFLKGVSHLGQIDLRNNSFPNLPQSSLDALNVSLDMLLQQNPWRCDRDILPLMNWLRANPSKANQTLVVCETPSHLKGEVIAMLVDTSLIPLNSTLEPVLATIGKRRKPNTPPNRPSTSSSAVRTTPTSENQDVTIGGQGDRDKVLNDIPLILIVIAVLSTVVISTVITSCVFWRRNKRGSGDIVSRSKNSVL